MKMNKDILTDMELDYRQRYDSNLFGINDELKELKAKFLNLEIDLAISQNVNK